MPDGTGYPCSFSGGEIPLGTRIFAVPLSYAAMWFRQWQGIPARRNWRTT